MSRGVGKQAIFRDDVDRERFLSLLRQVVIRGRWRCLTYCLMGNHYHLVVQLREANLSEGMQRLNGDHARGFNDRHDVSGHVFERRFWSRVVRQDAHMVGLVRYVALNPVRAGLCTEASEWRWSAHRALVGHEPAGFVDVPAALCHFDEDLDRARAAYADVVADCEQDASLVIHRHLRGLLTVADRDQAIVRAHREAGHSVTEIAATLGCHPKTVRRRLAAVEL